MREDRLQVGLALLDRQLVDRDDVPCGKVDDVVLRRSARGLRLAAVLSGPGAWPGRLPAPLARAAERLLGDRATLVDWDLVADVDSVVRLSIQAPGLARRRTRVRPLPRGSVLLSSLIGARVVDAEGQPLGHVHDAEVVPATGGPRVEALLVGPRGMLRRLGLHVRAPRLRTVAWEDVRDGVEGRPLVAGPRPA
jgi:sporulation protein YlmC with PRC-barrel domain